MKIATYFIEGSKDEMVFKFLRNMFDDQVQGDYGK